MAKVTSLGSPQVNLRIGESYFQFDQGVAEIPDELVKDLNPAKYNVVLSGKSKVPNKGERVMADQASGTPIADKTPGTPIAGEKIGEVTKKDNVLDTSFPEGGKRDDLLPKPPKRDDLLTEEVSDADVPDGFKSKKSQKDEAHGKV